jgi:hypothetical protein
MKSDLVTPKESKSFQTPQGNGTKRLPGVVKEEVPVPISGVAAQS